MELPPGAVPELNLPPIADDLDSLEPPEDAANLPIDEYPEDPDEEDEDDTVVGEEAGIGSNTGQTNHDAAGSPSSTASPDVPVYRGERILTVVHTTGIQRLAFTFCKCANADSEAEQLLLRGFYPASVKRPVTVFTLACLDDFLLTNQQCKTSPWNYHMKLCRTTDGAFWGSVQLGYKALLRTSRQYRVLKWKLHAGIGHEESNTERKPGGLAIACSACPRPGINTPPGWAESAESREYPASTAHDGSFNLEHMVMRNPADNVSFVDGDLYFVAQERFDAHLKDALTRAKDERVAATCNEHRATKESLGGKAHLDATGIGASACSRHGFFIPHTVVDFQRGEAQRNMDYSVNWAWKWFAGYTTFVLIYDIACQYHINARKRFEASPFLQWPIAATFFWAIGQFHVHGHQNRCYARHSLSFVPNVGHQDGEVVETLWKPLNFIKDSIRGMATSHRKEVIDAHMQDSNWMKLCRLPKSLVDKWEESVEEYTAAKEAFQEIDRVANEEERAEWKQEILDAREARKTDASAMDIFTPKKIKPANKTQVRTALLNGDTTHTVSLENPISADLLAWLSLGISIDRQRVVIARLVRDLRQSSTDKAKLTISEKRQRLSSDIRSFNTDATKYLSNAPPRLVVGPGDLGEEWDSLEDYGTDATANTPQATDSGSPEQLPILMPSSLGIRYCKDHGLIDVVLAERELRKGEMNECLSGVRDGIDTKSYLYYARVRNATSVRKSLRSFSEIRTVDHSVAKYVRLYMLSRTALAALYDPNDPEDVKKKSDDLVIYKPITKSDLTVNTTILEATTRGARNKHPSWIWTFTGTSEEGSTFPRTMWQRGYERKDRWWENLNALDLEMLCVVLDFARLKENWFRRAVFMAESPCHKCYANGQARMWERKEKQSAEMFRTVRLAHPKPLQ
ncbi:uncharacterized protein BXZ73DRAFT_111633 [Epithele typhae]|uniref:uncharacterized protein n=1 Tax=Epithele typhae TaxID=378194 RepID=UPI0020072190|nr:uncharacterized protein BXZ73DRAFT_111633 [Epithele typhae]KAH9900052.1 hypothetical protein BXZ73DRAFT_111633 [Epithele typhae]